MLVFLEDPMKIKSEYTEPTDFKEEVKDLIVDDLKIIFKKEPKEEVKGTIIHSFNKMSFYHIDPSFARTSSTPTFLLVGTEYTEYTEPSDFKEEVDDQVVDDLKSMVKKEPKEEEKGKIVHSFNKMSFYHIDPSYARTSSSPTFLHCKCLIIILGRTQGDIE